MFLPVDLSQDPAPQSDAKTPEVREHPHMKPSLKLGRSARSARYEVTRAFSHELMVFFDSARIEKAIDKTTLKMEFFAVR